MSNPLQRYIALGRSFMLLFIIVFSTLPLCAGANPDAEKSVLNSPLAGQWYPEETQKLEATLREFFEQTEEADLKKVSALILPHAGYRFSGKIAASAVQQVADERYDRVIILGPTHRHKMTNAVSVPDGITHYKTPLGEVPLDTAFIDTLAELDTVQKTTRMHKGEHSVQIEFPLLQYALDPGFKAVPIVTGKLDIQTTEQIAEKLLDLIDQDTLVVISSDFTHYGPRYRYVPFEENVPEKLRQLDMKVFRHIKANELQKYTAFMNESGTTVCGRHPIGILIAMLQPEQKVKKTAYNTSGNMMGSYRNSVSYLSAAISGKWATETADAQQANTPSGSAESANRQNDAEKLPTAAKNSLLKLARGTIEHVLKHGEKPSAQKLDANITAPMRKKMGAFVTLKKNDRLRGCIGEIQPRRPLYKAVMQQAFNAAFADRRFPPVRKEELEDITIEISALQPPHRVSSHEEISIGRHGIILEKNNKHGVYLPHVAPEQGWTVTETLRHLARKAGLPPDAWKTDATLKVFTATVFSENGEP